MININRHNYEEFFLLYIDGELSAQQQQEVEMFVQRHTDLAADLDKLMQARLNMETVVFANKNTLYKPAGLTISLSNYEENFLLYIDDELDYDEKNLVETFVLQHPQLQDAFTLLKQAKLQPEAIGCPGKGLLYKKEEKPVVYFSRRRITVAAALMGMVALLWGIVAEKTNTASSLADTKKVTTAPVQKTIGATIAGHDVKNNNTATVDPVIKEEVASIKNSSNNIHPQRAIQAKQGHIIQQRNIVDNPIAKAAAKDFIITNKKEGGLIAKNESLIPKNKTTIVNETTVVPPAVNTAATPEATKMQQVVYRELNTDEDEGSPVYIGNMQINKNKLRGFLKKAGHLLTKAKDNDKDKIAIAGFTLHTK